MKKVSLVVLNKHREESLLKLRKLGVLHPEKKKVSSGVLIDLLNKKARAEKVLRILRQNEKEPEKGAAVNALSGEIAADIIDKVLEYADERKTLLEQQSKLKKEQSRIREWGDFNPADISFLASRYSLNLLLYKLSRKVFEKLPNETNYIILGGDKDFVRILVFEKIPGRSPFVPGEYSCSTIDTLVRGIQDKLTFIEHQYEVLADGKAVVETEIKNLLENIEFETNRQKMNVLDDAPPQSTVCWISGFVPSEDIGLIKKGAAENGWALLAEDPGPDDSVPTKLSNNRLVSLLDPVTNFLEILPGYNEPDVSGWFLFFFTIFFGMIFGDAVYGAIFIIIAVCCILANLKKGVHSGFKLLLLLGISNFVWGLLTCTWLGLDPDSIPAFLQRLSLPAISSARAAKSAYDEGIVRQNIMIFCFSLALVHLCIGHIIVIFRNKTLKNLAELGSIAMLIGMYGIVLPLIASNEFSQIPVLMPFVYILGCGFILNFMFANYDGSTGKSIRDGFVNIVSMVLGIVNIFSDIMSYIRLWAVGLAGAAISSTVNAIAGPLLGHFFFFLFGLLIYVFGHSLNLVLNALSVLIHGVRLNTLEFSGHAGLTWSGVVYKPFRDQN